MIPDTSLPTSTWFVGCSVPVAVTVTTSGPWRTDSVTYCGALARSERA